MTHSRLPRTPATLLATLLLTVVACSGTGDAPPGEGVDGAIIGDGDVTSGTGGTVWGAGGTVTPGAGGVVPGAGGVVSGAGGVMLGTGGLDAGTGGVMNGTGGVLVPVDCSGIVDAGFDLCDASDTTCGAVFTGSEGCSAVCAAAGLTCLHGSENLEGSCGANTSLPNIACESGHQSDYCLCGGENTGTGGSGTGGTGTGGSGTGGSGTGGASSGSCSDGIQNGTETAVDCGGSCAACPTCTDGVRNGTETAVDCGGSCAACPTCTDGVRNGTETAVDCGGSCAACPTCTDGVRNGTETAVDCGGSCAACPTCTDGVRNGTETGVDCGGSCSACSSSCLPTNTVTGWATQNGGTTGGGNASVTKVTTLSALRSAVSGTNAAVVEVSGTITGDVSIGSNKTLIGACGGTATIKGYMSLSGSNNVIVRNLNLVGLNCSDASDCSSGNDVVTVTNESKNIWFDHLNVSDGTDGNLDVTHGADFITISWTRFFYSNQRAGGHRFSNLIGHDDDNAGEDAGHLNVTFDHVWWDDYAMQRMPRVRFGKVHVVNSLNSAADMDNGIGVGDDCNIRVENNVFRDVPTVFFFNNQNANSIVQSIGNSFINSGGTTGSFKTAFTPPYNLSLESIGTVEASVRNGAGPR